MCQCVYRHLQAEGLQSMYNDAEDCKIQIASHMLCALAFISVQDVEKYYN